jgi:hypothetical protein
MWRYEGQGRERTYIRVGIIQGTSVTHACTSRVHQDTSSVHKVGVTVDVILRVHPSHDLLQE